MGKGDHSHMPSRTDAYLPGDERGHVNASSLGGVNSRANVVAQHSDVNHGAYLSVEKGERTALQNGATIESEKTAVVNSQPGDRPSTFTVNDSVTYPDGHTEAVHYSSAVVNGIEQRLVLFLSKHHTTSVSSFDKLSLNLSALCIKAIWDSMYTISARGATSIEGTAGILAFSECLYSAEFQ